MPRLSCGSIPRQLPIVILLDRVVKVTLKKRTGRPEYQSAQLSRVAFMEGAFKGCRSKEIDLTPPPPLWGSGSALSPPSTSFHFSALTQNLLQLLLLIVAQPTSKLSCLHSPASSHRTEGGWPCKLGPTQTGRSQSVQSVCFWFAALNGPDCCNGVLHLWGFSLLHGELACAIHVYIKAILSLSLLWN